MMIRLTWVRVVIIIIGVLWVLLLVRLQFFELSSRRDKVGRPTIPALLNGSVRTESLLQLAGERLGQKDSTRLYYWWPEEENDQKWIVRSLWSDAKQDHIEVSIDLISGDLATPLAVAAAIRTITGVMQQLGLEPEVLNEVHSLIYLGLSKEEAKTQIPGEASCTATVGRRSIHIVRSIPSQDRVEHRIVCVVKIVK